MSPPYLFSFRKGLELTFFLQVQKTLGGKLPSSSSPLLLYSFSPSPSLSLSLSRARALSLALLSLTVVPHIFAGTGLLPRSQFQMPCTTTWQRKATKKSKSSRIRLAGNYAKQSNHYSAVCNAHTDADALFAQRTKHAFHGASAKPKTRNTWCFSNGEKNVNPHTHTTLHYATLHYTHTHTHTTHTHTHTRVAAGRPAGFRTTPIFAIAVQTTAPAIAVTFPQLYSVSDTRKVNGQV